VACNAQDQRDTEAVINDRNKVRQRLSTPPSEPHGSSKYIEPDYEECHRNLPLECSHPTYINTNTRSAGKQRSSLEGGESSKPVNDPRFCQRSRDPQLPRAGESSQTIHTDNEVGRYQLSHTGQKKNAKGTGFRKGSKVDKKCRYHEENDVYDSII